MQISPRIGFTILEVMIAVAILATALSVVGSTIYTMHQARTAIDEEIKVQAIAQSMAERVQGAEWAFLGRDISMTSSGRTIPGRNAWSWHRRATQQLAYPPPSNFPRPLRDYASLSEHDLQQSGLLADPSGIPGLQVYLEYYQVGLMAEMSNRLAANPNADPKRVWAELVGDPKTGAGPTLNDRTVYLPEDTANFDTSTLVEPALVIRVLVRWESAIGGIRWHELVVVRRS